MKKFVLHFSGIMIIPVFLLFLSSCEKEQHLKTVGSLQVSQGTYLGVIHLSWDPVDGAQYYNIQREDPQTGEWMDAATRSGTEVDDYGLGLPDNKLVPGKHYRYRISSASKDADDSGFREFDQEGWTYVPASPVSKAEWEENGQVLITWSDPIAADVTGGKVKNVIRVRYLLFRKEKGSMDSVDIQNTAFYDISPGMNPDLLKDLQYKDADPGADPVYSIKAEYHYDFINMDWGNSEGSSDFVSPEIAVVNGTGVGPTNDYDRLPINNVITSSAKGITEVKLKAAMSSLWAGVLKDVTGGYGTPAIYRFNGAEWNLSFAPYPDEVSAAGTINQMDFTPGASDSWMACLSHDSLYVFDYNNSAWSENKTPRNLGAPGSPSSIAISRDISTNEVFLALTEAPDYNLKVLRWTGSGWTSVGGDSNGYLTNGEDVISMDLQNPTGVVYLSYLTKNSDYNETAHIKRLNADNTGWEDVLEWTADNLMDIHITTNGNTPVYMTCRSQKPAEWPGGVFKVTSTTTVESLIPDNAKWFMEPLALTTNQDNYLFIVSTRIESQQKIYPVVYRYDGNQWQYLPGDFSDGTTPVGVTGSGLDVYYIYGDANELDNLYQPKTLKAVKFKMK